VIITTTDGIDGRKIAAYLGIVSGDAVMGTNIFRDMLASVRDIVGGRSGSYEKILAEAKEAALADLSARATALGADAVGGGGGRSGLRSGGRRFQDHAHRLGQWHGGQAGLTIC
jgi:uncharacterized protein YbjQ (UPF0145 family)